MESDALVVINAIKHCKVVDACFDLIIIDCISLLKEIPNCSVIFIRRSANHVACILARAYVSMSGLGVWYLDLPALMVDVLMLNNE